MTNYNERLDELWKEFGLENWTAKDEAKQAITSLIKELVAEAEPV